MLFVLYRRKEENLISLNLIRTLFYFIIIKKLISYLIQLLFLFYNNKKIDFIYIYLIYFTI